MSDERAMVRQVLDGDQRAFRLLVVEYQRLVEHMVGRLVSGREDREDLCQEIFTKVYFSLPRFRFDSRLSTWIATIAYRESINYLRRKKHRPQAASGEQDRRMNNLAGDNRPDNWVENRETQDILEAFIKELPEVQRTIITLYHLEGFKYEEIAAVTRLPEGTVKSYLFRARQVLKEKMIRMNQVTEA